MATSSMAIDTDNITDFEDGTVNQSATIDSTFSEVVTKFNASLETSTGHSHDGTDSRKTGNGYSPAEMLRGSIMGLWT